MKGIYFYTILILLVTILVSALLVKNYTENYDNQVNVNNEVERRYIDYKRDINKYRVGVPKFYEYQAKINEQPINGLDPRYNIGYPSNLPTGCNLMIVTPEKDYPFVNLLNDRP